MASASASVLPSITLGSSSSVPAKDFVSLAPGVWPSQAKNSLCRSLAFSPLPLRPTDCRRAVRIVARATGDSTDPTEAMRDVLKSVQDAWDKTDDKLAVGGLGFTALIALWASAGLIGAIDKLPIIPNFFEFVGILFSGWFIYRFLLFKPDRVWKYFLEKYALAWYFRAFLSPVSPIQKFKFSVKCLSSW